MEQRVVFKEETCKSCQLCVKACPTNVIYLADYLNAKGYRPAVVTDQDSCISCGKCAQMCPDSVITVYRPEKARQTV
ncbi:4Fe-4S binding protein [Bacillus sp. REN3]|uniref:4Fe-4S binding protein n=1 Tax=Bacillus sp. REN3 TaxID=2802440 RepID=UPI0032C1D489